MVHVLMGELTWPVGRLRLGCLRKRALSGGVSTPTRPFEAGAGAGAAGGLAPLRDLGTMSRGANGRRNEQITKSRRGSPSDR